MSPTSFRTLLVVSLALSVATATLNFFAESKLPPELLSQIDSLYEKHALWKLSIAFGGTLIALILGVASFYGLFFFRKWAPSLALNSTLLAGIAISFFPPFVSAGVIETLNLYGAMLWGALIAYAKSDGFAAESTRRAEA